MKAYDHKKIEKKWQTIWEKAGVYKAKAKSPKKKFYPLIEFPYPSGDGLHVGHIRSNTAMDIIARKRRMEGFNVLYPIGWDAFGLPTENYAIKTGIHPKIVTKKNTDNFRKQLKSLGFSFDWSREINTTDPAYYKWTQWIFLQFFKKGLAYKAKRPINWCLSCKIGLADEEVINGACERCGGKTEKREKEQWMMAITKYAERLDKDLDGVNYLEKIKVQQRNWIGKSEGAEIEFPIKDSEHNVRVFTTRADTLFGATYLVLAPEHQLVRQLSSIANIDEVNEYVKKVKTKSEIERTDDTKEKTGVELKGIKAINPASGEEISVWIADYVLAHYGTGAIMAVPAHDERDGAFAKKFDIAVKEVVEPLFEIHKGDDAIRDRISYSKRSAVVCIVKHWSEDKYLVLKWKKADWTGFVVGGIEEGEDPIQTGKREIEEETGYKSAEFVKKLGSTVHSRFYHVIKKQNRWGYFTGMYYELKNGDRDEITQEEKDIHDVLWLSKKEISQVTHDDMNLFWDRSQSTTNELFVGDGILANSGKFSGMESVQARKEITEAVGGKMVTTFKLRDWVFSRQRYWGEPIPVIHCPKCGYVAVPEKDLPVELPTVKKYTPTDDGESPLSLMTKWVNVKCPTCKGPAKRETDTMPNWAGSSWYYLRYIDPKNKNAFAGMDALKYFTPVDWYNGGMEHTTLHLLYSRFWHKFLYDLKLVPTPEPYAKRTSHGLILADDGSKISKSKGNGVKPEDVIVPFGADSVRLYEMFMGPFDQAVSWDTNGIVGVRRFIERVWKLQDKIGKNIDKNSVSLLHKTIKKVSEDIEEMKFNTAISSMMILVNELERAESISQKTYETLLVILAPFAPHVTEELWQILKHKKSIHLEPWPTFDPTLIVEEMVVIAVQIDGKVRATFTASPDSVQAQLEKIALGLDAVKKWLPGGKFEKVFYVKNKLLNFLSAK
jgi:leucyl-tRNA synthetase